jgi:abequosyltransferase
MHKPAQEAAAGKPLLTIAIPTYNRVLYLRQLLSALFDQLISETRVDLVICDNASPDDTPALVEEYLQRGLPIRYLRNSTNIGADANFLQCFEQARGKYVWIFGDDDIIVPGGLSTILSSLAKKDYDLVYVGSFPLQDTLQFDAVKSIKAVEFEDAEPFVKRVHVYFTFISGNIVNKDRVLAQKPASFLAMVGSNLVQLTWTYTALNGFERGLYIHTKLVGARVNNTGGYKLSDVFGSRLKKVTDEFVSSERLRRLIFNGTLQRFWPGMLLDFGKSGEAFESDTSPATILAGAFKGNPRYWFFVYPILVLPHTLGICWFFLVRIVNWIDRAFGFVLSN